MNMNAITKLLLGSVITGFAFLQACNNNSDNEQPPVPKGTIVVNAGNFGSANGSISYYDEKLTGIENYVVKKANGGSPIGAGIESILGYGDLGIILCNAPDKLEYIDLTTMKYVTYPTTDITTPRYMTAYNGIGYITCWGPWSEDWTLEESYVAVLNIGNGNIMDSIPCGSGPEGIIIFNNKLYIANSYDSTITVYDVSDFSRSTITLEAAPQHMIIDANDILWVSVTSAYGKFSSDKTGLTGIETTAEHNIIANINIKEISEEGVIAYDKTDHNIYILTAQAWPGTATEVLVFDTDSKQLNSTPVVSGENFSGIGINENNGRLYIANAEGFQGDGKIEIYDKNGTKTDEATVAIGPTSFLFLSE